MLAWVLEKSHGTRGHPGREPWASARRLTDATDPHPHASPRSATQPIRVSGDLLLPVERLAREKPLRCGPAATIRHVASLMSRRHRGAALVEDGGVQGIVTDTDPR
ncbi:MAG: CBS domain-containing protein [Actinobacteria bacterium]|nr:CBS domain-containing protein [Actinomycetota bacterium]